MRTRLALIALLLVWIPLTPVFAAPSAKEVEAKAAELAANEIADGPAAGMSILVARKGKVLMAKGYGYADLENKVPATEHTVYRLGSLSKQFTATATMQLVDQGLVRLDDSIRKYLPEYPPAGQPITVRHLLNHTSGLVNYTSIGEYWKHVNDDVPHSAVLDWFTGRELISEPGATYSYCNTGYFLLGMIVERASGERFQDYVRENIFDPLKLKETNFYLRDERLKNEAHGYTRSDGKLVPARTLNPELIFSVGALASSVRDIYTFNRALRDGTLVTPESYAIMTSPAWLNDGEFTKYGMGFHVDDWGGHRALRHGGLVYGFKSCFYYYPEEDLTIIVMMNTESSEYRPIQAGIARLFIPDLGAGVDYE